MTGKILVAIDSSKMAEWVLEYSAKLAEAQGLGVIVLNVMNTDLITDYQWVAIKDKLEEELEGEARKAVKAGKEYIESRGIEVEGIVRRGTPHEEIVAAAASRKDVEAVIMGAYGKKFLERQIVGSQTENVLRGISKLCIPLIIVPALKTCMTD
jgi:nucleotide-binding universal stress UspA family protein